MLDDSAGIAGDLSDDELRRRLEWRGFDAGHVDVLVATRDDPQTALQIARYLGEEG